MSGLHRAVSTSALSAGSGGGASALMPGVLPNGELIMKSAFSNDDDDDPEESVMEGDDDDGVENKNPTHMAAVADMSSLTYLEEDNVILNLRQRYKARDIYTWVSDILIAVNPYEELPVYGEKIMDNYRSKRRAQLRQLPPHCYAVAEESYQLLARTNKNQSMVICGESGSGKTESAKVFMRYLAHITHGAGKSGDVEAKVADAASSVEERFLQVNPILEAFGNAQTLMNSNSSRFGKFTKVLFENTNGRKDSQGRLIRPRIEGSFVETYLLEKSRVVFQEKGERNYHIFYQLCRGLSPEEKKTYAIEDLHTYYYLNQSQTFDIPGVSDEKKFATVRKAFADLSFSDNERHGIFCVLSAILHLGNVRFQDTDSNADECHFQPATKNHVTQAARLLFVKEEALSQRLLSRNIKAGGQSIVKHYKAGEAEYNRDAITKSLYRGLFHWIVNKINEQLVVDKDEKSLMWIGILDVFGFESSEFNNSFEQFCINFANERLQQFFNYHVIMSEQAEYLREALPWKPIQIADNQDIIDLIGKNNGIISILDSVCKMPKASDEQFVKLLFEQHKKNPRIAEVRDRKAKPGHGASRGATREKMAGFSLMHYAGKVVYNANGFLDKNSDSDLSDTLALFTAAEHDVVKEVLLSVGETSDPRKKTRRRASSVAGFSSVGSNFTQQLGSLMDTLESTTPHFIRCINPNQFKRSAMFDKDYVRPQLRCGGLVEALRIIKLGFPSRVPYKDIYERYGKLLPHTKFSNPDQAQRDFSEAVFVAFGMEKMAYQLGLTKVFFRPGKQEFLERVLGDNPQISPNMQETIRSLMVRKRYLRLRSGVMLCVRAQLWAKKNRTFQRIARAAGVVRTIAAAFRKSLAAIKRQRAIITLQAACQTVLRKKEQAQSRGGIVLLQKWGRHMVRRQALQVELQKRMASTLAKRIQLVLRVQQYWRTQYRARALQTTLGARVAETRKRKDLEAHKKKEQAEAEERIRQAKLLEERKRWEEEQAKKKVLEEKERQERELREKERLEAEELQAQEERRKREEELALLKKQQEEELKRQEEEERKRLDEEQAKKKREEDARRRKEEARRREEMWQAAIARATREKEEKLAETRAKESVEDKKEESSVEPSYSESKSYTDVSGDSEEKKRDYSEQGEGTRVEDQPGSTELPKIPEHILSAHMEERKRQKEEQQVELASQMRNILLNGGKFLKHGKRGQPHIRYVCINVLGNLHWSNKPMEPRKLLPSTTFIKLKDVLQVVKGKTTSVLQRKTAKKAEEELCFSIIATERTVDLQAMNVKERDLWVRAIESAVKDAQAGVVDFITGKKKEDEKAAGAAVAPDIMSATTKAAPAAAAPAAGPTAQVAAQVTEEHRRHTLQVIQKKPARPGLDILHSFNNHDEKRQFLRKGGQCLIFGPAGKPLLRFINCDDERLYWGTMEKPSDHQPTNNFILLQDVQSVHPGKVTPIFRYKSTNALSPPENCFSLVLAKSTLDLQCESMQVRNDWVEALQFAIDKSKEKKQTQHMSLNPRLMRRNTVTLGALRNA